MHALRDRVRAATAENQSAVSTGPPQIAYTSTVSGVSGVVNLPRAASMGAVGASLWRSAAYSGLVLFTVVSNHAGPRSSAAFAFRASIAQGRMNTSATCAR